MILPTAPRHSFYFELAKLLAAGFGIREAAAVVRSTSPPSDHIRLLDRLEAGLDQGMSITDSLTHEEAGISSMERCIIGAGEKGGRLAAAFQHLAEYYSLLENARRTVLRSAIYPLVILHLGIIVAVVPAALMHGEGHVWLRLLAALGILYVGLGLFFMLLRAVFSAAASSAKIDGFLNRLPFIGKARVNMAMARFTKVYHISLLAGLTMVETVAMASEASDTGSVRKAGIRLAAAARSGDLLGPVFLSSKEFSKAFARSYATSEASGTLDKDLQRWSEIFQQEAESSARALSIMLPKVLYVLVMLYVGWKILDFWSNYYEFLDKIGE